MIRVLNYLPQDTKAMEVELNRLARKGWELHWLWGGVAHFHKTQRRDLQYCVELHARKAGRTAEEDQRLEKAYIQLCDDAGWVLADESGLFRIFASKPGANPAPLQTDPELDFEHNWKAVLKRLQWNAVTPLLLVLVLCLLLFRFSNEPIHLWDPLRSNGTLIWVLALAVLYLTNVLSFFQLHAFRRRCREALAQGESLPVSAPRRAKLRGLIQFLYSTVLLAALLLSYFLPNRAAPESSLEQAALAAELPVVRVTDVDAGGESRPVSLYTERSLFLFHVNAIDGTFPQWLRTDYYRCRWPWLADVVADSLRSDEEKPVAHHLHDPITLSPVDLGFDRAWLYEDGEGWSSLLLQQGTTVASVEGKLDFRDPQTLRAVCARLGMEAVS